jgi:cyclic-di-GMP phosphodiesterase TipF (flagellum assembly factor)
MIPSPMTQKKIAPPTMPKADPAKPRPRKSRGGDVLVHLAIPIVAAAIAMALHSQLALPWAIALALAALAAVSLTLVHVVHSRGVAIRQLQSELARARAQPQPPTPRPMPEGGDAATARRGGGFPAPPHPRMAAGPAMAAARPGPPVAPIPAPVASGGEAGPIPASRAGATAGNRAIPPAGAPKMAEPQPGLMRPPVQPAAQPASSADGWRTAPGAPSMPSPGGPAPTTSAAAGGREAGAETATDPQALRTPEGDGRMPDERAPRAEPRLSEGPADPVMAPYWALRPGIAPEPQLASRESPAPGGYQEALASLKAAPPMTREAAMPAPAGVEAPELATMQKLIRQLAEQLNTPKVAAAVPAGSPVMPEGQSEATSPTTDEAVTASVAALKATAETMRAAVEPPARGATPPSLPQIAAAPADAAGPHHAPSAPDLAEDPPLPSYARLAQVSEAIAAQRIDLMLDPILGLGDRKARHFEVSVRLRTGEGDVLAPEEVAELAAGTGLVAKLDTAKLERTVRVADRLKARGNNASLFSTLSVESLSDGSFLDAFDEVFAGQSALLARLVVAFSQADVRQFSDGHWSAIESMANRGLRLALEDVTDLDMDFDSLREHGFDFIKLDADVFLNGLPAPEGRLPSADICRHSAELGLALIVGHIEDEASLAKVHGFGVLYGQGALFGGPRAVAVEGTAAPRTAAA